ncbi:hypothetical protein ACUN3E_37720 [Streptomyces sp. Ju416(a)]|uniref:hypothetical protein n=1 Tax=Streptomyces sp. Ju416(a) TaxID=3446591 RepID=UPI00403E2E05
MKHTHGPNFGRRVDDCGRCDELAAGAEPIRWNQSARQQEETRRIAEIRVHDCRASGCGPVCTYGDW